METKKVPFGNNNNFNAGRCDDRWPIHTTTNQNA
jgi:hypothetical protein